MKYTVDAMRTPPETYAWSRFGQPEYTDWLDESLSWKETCYIGDWSFLWQYRFSGPDVLKLFSDITVNSYERFDVGQSKHAIHTNKDGKVIHEGVLTRLAEDDYVLHGRGGFWAAFNIERGNYAVTAKKEDWFIFQVSGPNSLKVLNKVTDSRDLLTAQYMRVVPVTIAGHDCYALRQGMAGELGFELQGPKAASEAVYNEVLEAGRDFGIRRMGARVALLNHLEASFPTIATDYIPAIFDEDMKDYLDYFTSSMPPYAQPAYIAGSYDGKEISEYYRSPVELGWSKVVNLSHNFLGRDALKEEKENPRRVLRTLEWNPEDVIDVYASVFQSGDHYDYMEMPRDQRGFMWADRVERDGALVGVATSRGYSYYFRKMLSLVTIDVDHAELGTEVNIIWGAPGNKQKPIRATVAPAPYKEDRSRGDLSSAL